MIIKLTNTTLGLSAGGIIKPKNPSDPPFEVSDELGTRLIRDGKATLVFAESDQSDESNIDGAAENTAPEISEIPEYNEYTSKSVLQSIANEYGVETAANATKQEIINALDNFFADMSVGSEDE